MLSSCIDTADWHPHLSNLRYDHVRAGGQGLAMLRLEVYPHNPDPQDPTHVSPFNEAIAGVAHETDEILGIVFILAITLHIAGALKHHLMDKDGTLRRMLGKN